MNDPLKKVYLKVGDKLELEENFLKYKQITLSVMEVIKMENYETLDDLFKQRQLILDNIKNLNHSQDELKKVYVKYNIDELEKTLEKEIIKRKEELLNKIKANQKRRMALNGYNNLQAKSVFLSREF